MATRAQKIKVGIFLIVGLTLFITIFIIIQERKREPTETYFIKFQESVSGLVKDSKVLYKGVEVGKVQDIRVTENNDIIVRVDIETNRVKLREGIRATLGIANLMGGMMIELSGGDPGAPELAPGSYIPSKLSILEDIAKELPKILDEIRNILSKLDRSLGDVQEANLGRLVHDADDVVKSADQALKELTFFLHETRGEVFSAKFEISQTARDLRKAIVQAQRAFRSINENPSSIFWGRSKPDNPYVR